LFVVACVSLPELLVRLVGWLALPSPSCMHARYFNCDPMTCRSSVLPNDHHRIGVLLVV
jgi:hypothetical protein